MEWWSDGVEMRIVGSGNGGIHWLKWWFSWFRNGLEGPPGFGIAMAEKRGTWGIIKKVFLELSKNAVFLQFLKRGHKTLFHSMNMGSLSASHFYFSA